MKKYIKQGIIRKPTSAKKEAQLKEKGYVEYKAPKKTSKKDTEKSE